MRFGGLPLVQQALTEVAAEMPASLIGIRGVLYDPRDFDHPGGAAFIDIALGTDATALFETHHLRMHSAEAALRALPRQGTYATPEAYDFRLYHALRKRVSACLRGERRAPLRSRLLRGAAVAWAALAHLSLLSQDTPCSIGWWIACAAAAVGNTLCGACGHNALHRMEPLAIMLDWNGLSCYEWLHEHVHSHHMFVNTAHDHDSISMEPFVQWIPARAPCLLGARGKHIIYAIAELAVALQGHLVHRARWRALGRAALPLWMRLAPFVFLLRLATHLWAQGIALGVGTFACTMMLAGYVFAFLAHLSHPYSGDGRPDFARHQLRNTHDLRHSWLGGIALLYLDRQMLHHLFPALDHALLTDDVKRAVLGEHFYRPGRSIRSLSRGVDAALRNVQCDVQCEGSERRSTLIGLVALGHLPCEHVLPPDSRGGGAVQELQELPRVHVSRDDGP